MWLPVLSADPTTFDSLRKLWGLAREDSANKPLVIWVGAGASSWLGYQRWDDLAAALDRSFARSVSTYRRVEAKVALSQGDYPSVFQYCFSADEQQYRTFLVKAFSPQPMKAVYRRFLAAIEGLGTASLVTTNVDEMLERSISGFELVQRSDLERIPSLLAARTRFIAKLHGSVSSIESTVFRSDDYDALAVDLGFMESVRALIASSCIVFVGYSLRDQYILDLLSRHTSTHELFGGGPHFLVSGEVTGHPAGVNLIRYRHELHTDHRSSILAVELLSRPKAELEVYRSITAEAKGGDLVSAHLLSDFCPSGTYREDEAYEVTDEVGGKMRMIVGPDWSREELSSSFHSAHDLAMALLCFDKVLVSLQSASRVFDLLGERRFDSLLREGVLHFVHWEGQDSVMLRSADAGFGALATARSEDVGPGEMIARRFKPSPGKEAEASALMRRIETSVTSVDLSGALNFADICNGLFVSPSLRTLLGIGEATPVGNIPRWVAHEALRIVQIARAGAACKNLGLGSMKIMPGTARFAQTAFAVMAGGPLASEAAEYVLTGEFGILAERAFNAQPTLWDSIISFRQGNVGTRFRQELLRLLMKNEGAEIVPSIDASLRQALPAAILNEARKAMSALLLANGRRPVVQAIWSDSRILEEGPSMWRKKSRQRLAAFLQDSGLGDYDDCPCGSYEKVKFCCLAALDDR